MSDGYDVMRLQADFEGQEFPWTYPLALNGRKLVRFSVDGVEWAPARECEVESTLLWDFFREEDYYEHRLSCGHVATSDYEEPPRFCCECGVKIRKAVKR